MATHSSILAWRIPWMEEPGRLQSMWSQRIGQDRVTSLLHCHSQDKCRCSWGSLPSESSSTPHFCLVTLLSVRTSDSPPELSAPRQQVEAERERATTCTQENMAWAGNWLASLSATFHLREFRHRSIPNSKGCWEMWCIREGEGTGSMSSSTAMF